MDKKRDSRRYVEGEHFSKKSYCRKLINRFDAGPLLLVGFLILIFSIILNYFDSLNHVIFRYKIGIIGVDVILFIIALILIFFGLRKCR